MKILRHANYVRYRAVHRTVSYFYSGFHFRPHMGTSRESGLLMVRFYCFFGCRWFKWPTQGWVTSCFYLNLKILPPGGRFNVRYFQDRTGTFLNRFKEAYTWVLANETTPIVIPLKSCSSHNFFGLLTDIFDHSWIQVAVSLPKRL